jgi:5'-deoxynucleotidase YfbR-like HD superfamily hydrolase
VTQPLKEASEFKATINSEGGRIATYTGHWITPLDPNPDDVDILDIAHALANSCRFTGHVREFYSVAQHSVLASTLVSDEFALTALLHDASEAYLSDIARPIKNMPGFGDVYHEAEAKLEAAIAAHFGTPFPMPPEVKVADNLMLWAEMRDLMPNDPPDGVDMYDEEVIPWSPKEAEGRFLYRFSELSLPSEAVASK